VTPVDRALALTVACGLKTACGAAAGAKCVNSFAGTERDEPHDNRLVRARRALFDADQLFDMSPNAGSAS
jgi:hypothetical protein